MCLNGFNATIALFCACIGPLVHEIQVSCLHQRIAMHLHALIMLKFQLAEQLVVTVLAVVGLELSLQAQTLTLSSFIFNSHTFINCIIILTMRLLFSHVIIFNL